MLKILEILLKVVLVLFGIGILVIGFFTDLLTYEQALFYTVIYLLSLLTLRLIIHNLGFVFRIVGSIIFQTSAVFLVAYFVDGIIINDLYSVVLMVLIIALLNAVIRPLIIYYTLPITLITVGFFSLFINGGLILLASEFSSGVTIINIWDAILLSIGLTITNSIFNWMFSVGDSDTYYRSLSRRHGRKVGKEKDNNEKPGILFLEIDGLAKPIFVRALKNGYMPTLAKWLRESHDIAEWECDTSCQTSASQSGILLGDNSEISAFRWFDRENQEIVSSSKPEAMKEVEEAVEKQNGLLKGGGLSLNNMFTGGASNSLFTLSVITDRKKNRFNLLYYYFLNPNRFVRLFVLVIKDIISEVRNQRNQKKDDIQPRVEREFYFPMMRAFMTTIMPDLIMNMLIGEIFEGVPSAYVTFVAYDEVAHFTGIERQEAMTQLQQLGERFKHIAQAIHESERNYKVVVLSDHGQSQGETFTDKFGFSLGTLVGKLAGNVKFDNEESINSNEAVTQINNVAKSPVKNSNVDEIRNTGNVWGNENGVVLASGNLGLIYMKKKDNQQTVEEINNKYPSLVNGLAKHEGISFIVVKSEKDGVIALGTNGKNYLESGKIEGDDPLESFRPNTAKHLLRTFSFSTAPDILLNGLYDPETEEVSSFEEMVGSHGGFGGYQSRPFIMYPKEFEMPKEKIVGAGNINKLLRGWKDSLA